MKENAMFKKLCFVVLCFASAAAQAVIVTGQVVADDFYKVFVGDAAGSSLVSVGDSGTLLWNQQGAAFTFNVNPGQYIYVAAWDGLQSQQMGPPHAWIGQFDFGAAQLLSNTTDWVSKYSAVIKPPTDADVSTLAQDNSAWGPLLVSMPNGSSPYKSFFGGSSASLVWHDSFGIESASENGYALFRSKIAAVAAVPEPETYAMLLAGLGLIGAAVRRRRSNQA
jgi:hypothetical protein